MRLHAYLLHVLCIASDPSIICRLPRGLREEEKKGEEQEKEQKQEEEEEEEKQNKDTDGPRTVIFWRAAQGPRWEARRAKLQKSGSMLIFQYLLCIFQYRYVCLSVCLIFQYFNISNFNISMYRQGSSAVGQREQSDGWSGYSRR